MTITVGISSLEHSTPAKAGDQAFTLGSIHCRLARKRQFSLFELPPQKRLEGEIFNLWLGIETGG